MASTSPWAALYFVALMTFGNYVLFNLLVAILVEGFQAEGDASRSESDDDNFSSNFDDEDRLRELISSGSGVKVQTLLPISNGHLEPKAIMPPYHAYTTATPKTEVSHVDNQSLRSSNASYEHHDQRSMSSLWGSRRSSWNSLGHAPSLKRRGQSGEHESLLSGEDRDSFEHDQSEEEKTSRTGSLSRVSHLESFDLPELLQVPPIPHLYGECNGRLDGLFPSCPYNTQRETSHAPPEQEEDTEQSWCVIVKRMLEPYKPQWCRDHEDWSLYVFSPQNKFRVRCQKIISHRMFDHIVLVFIFLNCITIALERPDIQPHSMERVFLSVSNYIFTVIFVAEMTVKVVSMGMYVGPGSYLQSSWNVLDGLLVFVSIVDILVSLASSGGNRILGILRVLRLLRTLRPLRVISRAPGLKLVVETLITSLRPIGNIVLICCAFFIVFGILGVQLFKGKFYHCEGFDTRNITNRSECLQANYRWVRRKYNFDNLGQVGNLGLLFMLLFFIYAALGVELFGKLECSEENPCEGLSRHATFENFGMAFLTLFRDTLRECKSGDRCLSYLPLVSPLYFVTFVLVAQFVLVNVVVAVLMKHLEDSNKDACEEAEMEAELEAELQANLRQNPAGEVPESPALKQGDDLQDRNLLTVGKPSISRMLSLPNDSYMFYPKAGHKPREQLFSRQQTIDHTTATGSCLSVNSELCKWESLLQVPRPFSSLASRLEPLPPHHVRRQKSVRMLQRQEAIKSESVDSAGPGSMDTVFLHHNDCLKVPSIPYTGGSVPCSPRATPPMSRSRTASVQTSRRVYSQRSIPSRRSTHTQPDTYSHRSNTHTSDEEIRQILSSVERQDSAVRLLRRSHTLSPHAAGALYMKSQSQRSNSTGSDLRKYNSMDSTYGAWSNLQQKNSMPFKMQETEVSLLRRKHKMSPPCVLTSTEPPVFSDTPPSGPVLKRRAPSFDSTLRRDSLDLPESLLVAKPLPQPCLSIHLSVPFEQSNNHLSDEDQSTHCVLLDA
ncbi:Voltage-dependent T-type calcium channel subunit alpha-1H [Bagarius yarrelli]|uniref:Voltage-dependent T-type calcium channel subunit alpha-1H n=1 Tax=Bagarius yarrelli TaxID=175774 RepID=A0A556VAR7_BAGYA|nr:Voltage-dependent T-type calcium channel subunit alpha-1H [Bagarius yarrelli]